MDPRQNYSTTKREARSGIRLGRIAGIEVVADWSLAIIILLIAFIGFRFPLLGGGAFGGLWLMFIGWFLNNAAVMGYRQLVVTQILEDVPVARVMQTELARVQADLSVRTLAEERMMASGQRVLPVERNGRFLAWYRSAT